MILFMGRHEQNQQTYDPFFELKVNALQLETIGATGAIITTYPTFVERIWPVASILFGVSVVLGLLGMGSALALEAYSRRTRNR